MQTVQKQVDEIPQRSNRPRRKSALSLKKVHNKLTDIDYVENEDVSNKPKDKFTEIQLVQQWQAFGEKIKAEGALNSASVINVNKPVLDKEGNVLFILPTKLMQDHLASIKPKLLRFLRNSLNNFSFELKTQVIASQKKTRAYLPKEKFEKLAEENPDLILLKNKFGLDI